jgi:predicted enzyme related to lactoylglutathione lyase
MERLSKDTNALNWFEIPANDIKRAKKFYEQIFEIKMDSIEMEGTQMAMFPTGMSHSGDGVAQGPDHKPNREGSIIYLNGNPDLQHVLDRIEASGG